MDSVTDNSMKIMFLRVKVKCFHLKYNEVEVN